MALRRVFLQQSLAALGTALALPAAFAQSGDAGAYQILGARYGTAQESIDVTERLRDLARSDRRVRVENRLFGVDPVPNRVKALRIYARGPGGAVRTFEYVEGSVIDGSQFTGWERGDWHPGGWNGGWEGGNAGGDDGQFLILHARYGTPSRNIDVTERLKDLARRDKTFRVKNDLFGVDPAPHEVKVLRLYTRAPNGARRSFDYIEGSVVDGNQFSGWAGGDWGRERWHGEW